MKNPKYKADDKLTKDEKVARLLVQDADRMLYRLADGLQMVTLDETDRKAAHKRLDYVLDRIAAHRKQAARLDPEVSTKLIIGSLTVKL